MNLIEIKSPAKLNLHLQVLNRRIDGFHNISSLFTLIDITDGMSFERTDRYIDLVESTPIKDNIACSPFSKLPPISWHPVLFIIN